MKIIFFLFLCTFSLFRNVSLADDIDIVVSATSPEGLPYIHLVLDTSSSAFKSLCVYGVTESCAPPFMTQKTYDNLHPDHSTGDAISRFEVFAAVLATLFEEPVNSKIYVSLLAAEADSGGSMLSGYMQLGGDYGGVTGAQSLIDVLTSITRTTGAGSYDSFQAKSAFYTWYRYLNGEPLASIAPLADGESPAIGDAGACSKFFSIILATESSAEDGLLDLEIRRILGMPLSGSMGFSDLLAKVHSDATDLVKNGLSGVNFLEKAWFIAPSVGADLARTWAQVGGGGVPVPIEDPIQLERSLRSFLSQAISLSRTKVSVTIPMTNFVAAPVGSELYIGLYQAAATIHWPGNVKKFKLGDSPGQLATAPGEIVDARGEPAIVSVGADKGQLVTDALSFWTDAAVLPISLDPDVPPGADGRVVTRGGAGQQVPGFINGSDFRIGDKNEDPGSRQLWVEPPAINNGSANLLLPFDADGIGDSSTAAKLRSLLGAATTTVAQDLIRWGRGMDVDDQDGDGTTFDARPWIMGSVIHSKPHAVNYGAVDGYQPDNPNIRIFVGTGDGILHGIENTTRLGEESGREVFGFYPAELLANISLQRENSISSLEMRYGVDGSPVSFTVDNNNDGNLNHEAPENDEAYIYFGMRRGGYSYYAMDISDPGNAPTIKWKITRTSVDGDFAELGLSFSKPLVGKVRYEDKAVDVLIFAGGYNGGWDDGYKARIGKDLNANDDVSAGGGKSIGNAIYIVNARTGELVWKAVYGPETSTAVTSSNTLFRHGELIDSIPSSVSAIKNASGIIHRLYVGDTGGAVWRIDLPASTGTSDSDHRRERWFISKLAELGTDGSTTDRRFFHAPDIIRSKQNDGSPFDGILISSGDRAAPNNVDVVNYHFYIKDYLVTSGNDGARSRPSITISDTASDSKLPDRSACLVGGSEDGDFNCTLPTDKGWMIKLSRPGEKGLSSPLVTGGLAFFSSYVPATQQACTASTGQGYVYLVNLNDASSVTPGKRIYPVGLGIPAGVIVIGDQLLTPLGGVGEIDWGACHGKLCTNGANRLQKIYWREPGVDEY